jgi:hypothetical protein
MIQNNEPATTPPLLHRGMTVPYVVQWSSETVTLTGNRDLVLREHVVTGQQHIAYRDEQPSDREFGALWGRMPETPGLGEPLFASLNIARQRRAIAEARCSVCGGAGQVWMAPAVIWEEFLAEHGPGADYETSDPPLCRACVPVAAAQCPNLSRRGFVFLAPRKWAVSGVRGYVADPHTGAYAEDDVALPGAVGYDPARLRLTLAKGLLATLRGITVHTDPDGVHGLGRRRGDQPPAPGRARNRRSARIPAQRQGL